MLREDFLNSLIELCQNITVLKNTDTAAEDKKNLNKEVEKISIILKTHIPKLATLLTEAVIIVIDDIEMMKEITNEIKTFNKEIEEFIKINKPLNIFTLIHKYPLEFIEGMASYYLQHHSQISHDNLKLKEHIEEATTEETTKKDQFNKKFSKIIDELGDMNKICMNWKFLSLLRKPEPRKLLLFLSKYI